MVVLDDLAQPRDLHVDRAVEHAVFAAARELHQLVARQRGARMLHQHFEHRVFAGRQGDLLAFAREAARGEVEFENAKAVDLGVAGGRARRAGWLAAPQHRVHARHQLARVERLGQVIVGAHFQSDDAVHLVALGRQHDDRRPGALRLVVPEAAADRKAVLAGQHQVEHEEVVALARQLLVHRRRVGHRAGFETLLGEVAHHQFAQALVVIDDEDSLFQFSHGGQGTRCPVHNETTCYLRQRWTRFVTNNTG